MGDIDVLPPSHVLPPFSSPIHPPIVLFVFESVLLEVDGLALPIGSPPCVEGDGHGGEARHVAVTVAHHELAALHRTLLPTAHTPQKNTETSASGHVHVDT